MKIRRVIIPLAAFGIGYFTGEIGVVHYELKLLKNIFRTDEMRLFMQDFLAKDFIPANKKAFAKGFERLLYGCTVDDIRSKEAHHNSQKFSYSSYYSKER